MTKLTKKQQDVMNFIENYFAQYSNMPTIREIAQHFNISIAPVQKYLKILERKGALNKKIGVSRGIELTNIKKLIPVNVVGSVHAGTFLEPIEDIQNQVFVDADITRGRECFALKVKGDSMQPSGIVEGDTVIISKDSVVSNGDIVVALVNEEAAIKIYTKLLNDKICLSSTNPDYPPLYTDPDKCKILGKLIHLIREYR
ncbi:MAG: transcriptional repressor LexA [Elusimicrobiota bacterium]|jgi:repressor LexA|nr:transcriptional repressor LexA [Elusimicrobiota bacterium]